VEKIKSRVYFRVESRWPIIIPIDSEENMGGVRGLRRGMNLQLRVCSFPYVALSIPNFAILVMSLGMHYNTEAGDDIVSLIYLKDQTVFDICDGYMKAPTFVGLVLRLMRLLEELVRGQFRGSVRNLLDLMGHLPRVWWI